MTDFISNLVRVVPEDDAEANHYFGGSPSLDGALCPTCKIPLLQLLNIDCTDPLLSDKSFGPWKRLPFLFCWTCIRDVYCTASGPNAMHVIHTDQSTLADSSPPYESYPQSFPQRSALLKVGIPDDVKAIARRMIEEWQSSGSEDDEKESWEPSSEEQAKLTDYFGHPVKSTFCLTHHQIGGHNLGPPWQDDEYRCPNSNCKSRAKRGRKMTFVARILNAPAHGLPMIETLESRNPSEYNYDVAVQYHICESCFTLVGSNRSG
ncbi:hypothetical protein [Neorhodopirellula lusitana]|nr:hypothetical protein [Neorhodopirellula lusitana]